ncbi:polysaccharide deacetylase family protein [Desulfosudis oleivorans]|uniref:Polysaccharide deacetylase n=1 Tax=Desulfosudis oleivorans (strain DSM 6200 / JCM 39069 / Hxd3) TaxID=96561 RepID=A9A101_DESOH|nr:hypothetical protein [Desulfosudis oleivorans]ABW67626.1 conserved hypothetical protein [Desulfosudis oleivorans Hxd3]
MDFTLKTYQQLLNIFKASGYTFQTFQNFLNDTTPRAIILRHDVDKRPGNALKTAWLEHELGLPASYYFRAVPESWDEAIIRKIAGLGHEIGYHYENLSVCKGDPGRAWEDFQANLAKLRDLAPVTTICMHGSPLSRINNLDLWQTYDYKALGIVGEPYLDVDFTRVFYLTDTGRRWNHAGASIRDRVDSGFDIQVNSTGHLIALALEGRLPDRMMINTHPQRWEGRLGPWMWELVWQNMKNVVKKVLSG